MTNGNDDSTGRLYGVRAADGGDPTAASSKDAEETKETFTCPHCRRAFSASFVAYEIQREKENRKETDTAERWNDEEIG